MSREEQALAPVEQPVEGELVDAPLAGSLEEEVRWELGEHKRANDIVRLAQHSQERWRAVRGYRSMSIAQRRRATAEKLVLSVLLNEIRTQWGDGYDRDAIGRWLVMGERDVYRLLTVGRWLHGKHQAALSAGAFSGSLEMLVKDYAHSTRGRERALPAPDTDEGRREETALLSFMEKMPGGDAEKRQAAVAFKPIVKKAEAWLRSQDRKTGRQKARERADVDPIAEAEGLPAQSSAEQALTEVERQAKTGLADLLGDHEKQAAAARVAEAFEKEKEQVKERLWRETSEEWPWNGDMRRYYIHSGHVTWEDRIPEKLRGRRERDDLSKDLHDAVAARRGAWLHEHGLEIMISFHVRRASEDRYR